MFWYSKTAERDMKKLVEEYTINQERIKIYNERQENIIRIHKEIIVLQSEIIKIHEESIHDTYISRIILSVVVSHTLIFVLTNTKMSTQEIIDAIIHERLDYLESMLITNKDNFPVASYQWAIRYDKENVILLLLKHNFPKKCEDCSTAAKCNNLTLLRLLRDNNFPWRFGVMIHAIENDNMGMLKYAVKNNCPWSQLALELDYAEKFKRVEMLRYLKKHKCKIDIRRFLHPN